jgi:hypothetical protein
MTPRPVTLIFAALLCLANLQTTQAQSATDWALFPTHQRTFWRTDTLLQMHYCDSVATNGAQTTHYFGANYFMANQTNPCWDTVMNQYLQGAPFPLTTCISQAGIWTLNAGNGQTVPFNSLATPGQSWEAPLIGNGFVRVRFTCVGQAIQPILGGADSVKYFIINTLDASGQEVTTPLTGAEYRLSKAHGLLQYAPFSQLTAAAPDYVLIEGYVKNGIRFGFTNDFLDYFGHFKVGQVYKYHTRNFIAPKVWEVTQRDSLTGVQMTTAGVTLQFEYSRMSRAYTIVGGSFPNFILEWDTTYASGASSRTYQRSAFNVLNLTPDWYHFGVLVHKQRRGQHDDWLFHWENKQTGFYAANGVCMPIQVDDYVGPTVYSSKYGYFFQNQTSLSPPPLYYDLIGYKDDNGFWGNLDRISSTNDAPDLSAQVLLYPQPAHDALMLQLPDALAGEALHYRVYTVQGSEVKRGVLEQNTLKINDLGVGAYLLVLHGTETPSVVVKRFVKM